MWSRNLKTECFQWPENLSDEKWDIIWVADLRVLSVLSFSASDNWMCHELAHIYLLVHLHILRWKSLLACYLLSSHPVRLYTEPWSSQNFSRNLVPFSVKWKGAGDRACPALWMAAWPASVPVAPPGWCRFVNLLRSQSIPLFWY